MKKVILLTLAVLLLSGGCSSVNGIQKEQQDLTYEVDPYEQINRKIFLVNQKMDRWFLRPIAVGYNFLLPRVVRQSIGNMYGVIADINTSVNRLLQGNIRGCLANINRIVINVSFGVAGIFDVANAWGLKKDYSDFGITLAHWGSMNRPFVMIPFFGSATLNELIGKPVDAVALNIWIWIPSNALQWSMIGGYYVQTRASLTDADAMLEQAFDPYLFTRDAYLQRRQYLLEYDPYDHSNAQ